MHPAPDSPVIRAFIEKKNLLELGDPRHKDIPTAIVESGGCMSGVFGGGSWVGFQTAGHTNTADVLILSSAGVLNKLYMLAEQAELGVSIYYEDLIDGKFISRWRLNKMIDIDYLIEDRVRRVKTLDVPKIRRARSHIFAALIRVKNGHGVLMRVNDADDVITVAKAGVAIPGGYNQPVLIDGEYYMDGTFACPIPIREAVHYGAKNILVVLNKPFGLRPETLPFHQRALGALLMRNHSPEFRRTCYAYLKVYNDSIRFIERGLRGEIEGVNIGVIAPDSATVDNLCQDPILLKDKAREGVRETLLSFGITEVPALL